MTENFVENNVILESVKCFNLDLSLDCGQAFRWEKQSDDSWSGAVKGKYLNISKSGDTVILHNTTKEDYDKIWKDYFDFSRDYVALCDKLKEDKLLKSTIDEYYGIRILNQDPWEALVSFVISQQNNIKRIKLIISRLCNTYGEKITDDFYSFPDAECLAQLTVSDFEALGTGYRAKYLEKLAKDVYSGKIDLKAIKKMPLEDARKELMSIYGVGIKVANCALLFGFGFLSAFPVDVWMKRVMEFYPNGLPECFNGYEGIAQQYLFHWARNNLK